jgi:hypothetical protein
MFYMPFFYTDILGKSIQPLITARRRASSWPLSPSVVLVPSAGRNNSTLASAGTAGWVNALARS